MEKKYHISIEGEGTAEEVLESIQHIYGLLLEENHRGIDWHNIMRIQGTQEWYYEHDGILRTEINEVNE